MRLGRALMLVTLASATSVQASSAEYQFCWVGSNGYYMEGWMAFDASLQGTGLITQDQITGFRIEGFHEGVSLGSWSLEGKAPDTTWILTFDTINLEFPTGSTGVSDYQAWNADGTASNCGNPGFGFNAGNNAQDVCVNGQWITDSMIDRFTPFFVRLAADGPACGQPELLSRNLTDPVAGVAG
ncbi:MAG: hypothetical protein AAFV38_04625 [Pseudomonadota bacterium]